MRFWVWFVAGMALGVVLVAIAVVVLLNIEDEPPAYGEMRAPPVVESRRREAVVNVEIPQALRSPSD